jgi:hypothetical protein
VKIGKANFFKSPYDSFTLFAPHPYAFGAVSADVYIAAALQHVASKLFINPMLPQFLERACFQVAEFVLGIFIKAAGHHSAIPCNYRIVP